ncbi:Aste57867_18640 [Aphanomyces stellatus]|uniref:Aste57867_18640 protein n=1 Tax=Aphanomyces stellatus TaxID=120398 RepID=A0A485LCH9_9STRA|nr:hypothetical protein As57867_018578 [Aphanomyces stellatus]VFT95375.1 Aste57867_18640 [Aphanomyces stellatus]
MKFARTASSATSPPPLAKVFLWSLRGLGLVTTISTLVLVVVLATNHFDLAPTDRQLYIELCLQAATLMLTIAALSVQPLRFRNLWQVCQYLAAPTTSPGLPAAIQAAFEAIPIEFHNQAMPSGVNVPLPKILVLLVLLNGYCVLQYPATIVMWFVPDNKRPYVVVAVAVLASWTCGVVAHVWEWRLVRHTTRFRAKRAESAFEKYLVEDTSDTI